jgi:hypothetical protein
MKVVILVPRRAGIRDRDELWRFCRAWWERDHPDVPIVEGHHDDGPFNRSAAINRAAELAGDWDVAVIIDSDVLVDAAAVLAGIALAAARPVVVCGGSRQVHVDRNGTRRILGGWRGDWEKTAECVYVDHWSSVIIVGRPLWNLVGGYDPSFRRLGPRGRRLPLRLRNDGRLAARQNERHHLAPLPRAGPHRARPASSQPSPRRRLRRRQRQP